MNLRKIGLSEIEASVIGFGAWAIGGWMWGGTEEQSAISAIHTAIDNGVNLIDTAPMYGFGRSEEIVGKAIKGQRNQIVLATKCGLVWDSADWQTGKGELHFYSDKDTIVDESKSTYRVYKYLRPESIRNEIEQSLKRLDTDYIDLLQTHWQESTTPLDDTIGELIRLKKEGKIRAIGCSNASLSQLNSYIKSSQLDVDQERFSLLDKNIIQDGLFDACEKAGVSIFAYSPLANGLLTGKLTAGHEFGKGDLRTSNPRFQPENVNKVNKKLDQLKPIAQSHDLTVGQLVIAWTVAKYNKMHVLCGMRTPNQASENTKAGNITLANDEVQKIEEIFS
ncbi:MAG: aldo/keto reductase [Planctomycetaceae bacterium]|jgi:aryl-alcohol dehydrogenase-like predicted oxidoreductase|nr:aldo/keto reductase [Planctomycetaceae bacterium]